MNVPSTTPSVAIRFSTCTLYTRIRIQIKQLVFLQKILQRNPDHPSQHLLLFLKEKELGWAEQIQQTLKEFQLTESWEEIQQRTVTKWKKEVKNAAEKRNHELLKEECHKRKNGENKQKTKTKVIANILESKEYERKNRSDILRLNRVDAKHITMARYGMLKCKKNFKAGNSNSMCSECHEIDDEIHRMNLCVKLRDINWLDKVEKIVFEDIYSEDQSKLGQISKNIQKIWHLSFGQNRMRTT